MYSNDNNSSGMNSVLHESEDNFPEWLREGAGEEELVRSGGGEVIGEKVGRTTTRHTVYVGVGSGTGDVR